MVFLPNKDPLMTELEVEEVYQYMKQNDNNDINRAWLNLFLRKPDQNELNALLSRLTETIPKKYDKLLLTVQAHEIADAYRYHYGSRFNLRMANKITKYLFYRKISKREAMAVRRLIKRPEPDKANKLYHWIADEIKMIQYEWPTWSLEKAYKKLVYRPPFSFEEKLHAQEI